MFKDLLKIIGAVILCASVIIALSFGTKLLQVPMMKIDRNIQTNSHQYVDSHRASIVRYIEQYHGATSDAHKNAIRQLIKEEASKLPETEVPAGAWEIIEGE